MAESDFTLYPRHSFPHTAKSAAAGRMELHRLQGLFPDCRIQTCRSLHPSTRLSYIGKSLQEDGYLQPEYCCSTLSTLSIFSKANLS